VGHTYANLKIYSDDRRKFRQISLLVDTGSIYTWIHKDMLLDFNIEPIEKREFRTIKGDLIKRDIGVILVEYDGVQIPTLVVFGSKKIPRFLEFIP